MKQKENLKKNGAKIILNKQILKKICLQLT